MSFELNSVVPWGRNFDEYRSMFGLTLSDLSQQIISFGDGPSSFNFEMTKRKRKVISLDPIYQFSKDELKLRISKTKDEILKQTKQNQENFTWTKIKSVYDLERVRMDAMTKFLEDFELGKRQNRYIPHEMPNPTQYPDLSFDLGLSSHFLILYSQLGLDFHLQSISEMLRICKEIRIFPILNLNAVKSEVVDGILAFFQKDFSIGIEYVDYEFQKGGKQMMKISRK
ncbi:SAM-dependent methyltransferase [Pararhodonellum marinum]|uniref:SAM-dependent methyltransferase n=1 Tax=Pararhodonellum marinum TaxID=2755358 RepID=UPI00188FA89F|nr:SAM-dependent methyltransferase [Pararhodonellum marinum]